MNVDNYSQVNLLCKIFPSLTFDFITTIWESNNCDMVKTIDELLSYEDDRNGEGDNGNHNSIVGCNKKNLSNKFLKPLSISKQSNGYLHSLSDDCYELCPNHNYFACNSNSKPSQFVLETQNELKTTETETFPKLKSTESIDIQTPDHISTRTTQESENKKFEITNDTINENVSIEENDNEMNKEKEYCKSEIINTQTNTTKCSESTNNFSQNLKNTEPECYHCNPNEVHEIIPNFNYIGIPKMRLNQFTIVKPVIKESKYYRNYENTTQINVDDAEDFATEELTEHNFINSCDKLISFDEEDENDKSFNSTSESDNQEINNELLNENLNSYYDDLLETTHLMTVVKPLTSETKSEGFFIDNFNLTHDQNISSYVDFNSKSCNSESSESFKEIYVGKIFDEPKERMSGNDEFKTEYYLNKINTSLSSTSGSDEDWLEYKFDSVNKELKNVEIQNKQFENREIILNEDQKLDNKDDFFAAKEIENYANTENDNKNTKEIRNFGNITIFQQLNCYVENNDVQVKFNISKHNWSENSWIGIYDKFEMDNTKYLSCEYTKNSKDSTIRFKDLKRGKYTIRLFLNNKTTYKYEHCVAVDICIGKEVDFNFSIIMKNNKKLLVVKTKNCQAHWIGVYPIGKNPFSNSLYILASQINNGNTDEIDITNLKNGLYECRYFSKESKTGIFFPSYHSSGEISFKNEHIKELVISN
ncbi:hypothetical protein QTN25_006550 [Entamoeba marina]